MVFWLGFHGASKSSATENWFSSEHGATKLVRCYRIYPQKLAQSIHVECSLLLLLSQRTRSTKKVNYQPPIQPLDDQKSPEKESEIVRLLRWA